MTHSSVFYHYTSQEGLAGILEAETILASHPHPATPGMVGGSYIKDRAVFLTRMDPANSKEAIAYNNYSGGGIAFMKKVDCFVAVEITQGPHLEEESVKDGLYGFRNIVCWKNGDLQLSGNPRVKRFWSGNVSEAPGHNPEAKEGIKQVKAQTEPGRRRLSEPTKPHWPCLTPQNCPFVWCKENQEALSRLNKSDNKIARKRAAKKRPLEDVEPESSQDCDVKARSRWTDRDILEWL